MSFCRQILHLFTDKARENTTRGRHTVAYPLAHTPRRWLKRTINIVIYYYTAQKSRKLSDYLKIRTITQTG